MDGEDLTNNLGLDRRPVLAIRAIELTVADVEERVGELRRRASLGSSLSDGLVRSHAALHEAGSIRNDNRSHLVGEKPEDLSDHRRRCTRDVGY